MYDIHIHTRFSFDSEEEPYNYLKLARERHVSVIGFSEHYDYDACVIDGESDITLADLDEYSRFIEKARREFPDVQILFGIELGYRAEAVTAYKSIINQYNFDYVINSLHTISGRGDCYHERFFEWKTLRQSYTDYLNAVLESVETDMDYQIVGHLGYASRYRKGDNVKIRYEDYGELLDRILKAIIERDKCLEINTSSGTSGGDFLPDVDILERYLSLGGKNFSYGSDAHCSADYMRKCDLLTTRLKSLGVDTLCYYKERKKQIYKI